MISSLATVACSSIWMKTTPEPCVLGTGGLTDVTDGVARCADLAYLDVH